MLTMIKPVNIIMTCLSVIPGLDSGKIMQHVYRPVGSARELFTCRDMEVILSGAAGTGKTRACAEKAHAMAMLNPGSRGLIVRKTAVSLTSTTLVTFKEHVAKEALASGEVRWFGGSGNEDKGYKYANGSTITVAGMDRASRIMSSEYDFIYVGEATELTEDDWEALSSRLRNNKISFQQLFADCNPDSPYHWLKQRCDRGQATIIYCKHEDNPALYDNGEWTTLGKEYLQRLDNLTGVRKERLRYGRWAAADNLVYDEYDPNIHLRKSFFMPLPDWPRYLTVDFGLNNPFVCQWWVEDPDGRLIMYREIYRTGRLVEDHCQEIQKWIDWEKNRAVKRDPVKVDPFELIDAEERFRKERDYRRAVRGPDVTPVAVITDHDLEGRGTLERYLGLHTTAAHKSVLEGIDAVKQRLQVQADGKPRLMLCRDALVNVDESLVEAKKPFCTEQEILEYSWDSNRVAGGKVKEQPKKENDHGMDAMRYMVAFKDLKQHSRVRVLTW